MKVLLVGEFSAIHKNLKEGLQALGHEVVIASNGDGWKNIPRDIDLAVDKSSFFRKFTSIYSPLRHLDRMSGFDVVQLVNPFILKRRIFPEKYFFKKLMERNNSFFLLATGDDAYFWRYGRSRLEYSPFDDVLKYDLKQDSFFMENERSYRLNKYLADNADGVIPVIYEYEISYKGHSNLRETIPIPVNIHEIEYQPNVVDKKIVIFHGLNRYGFKGTRHVEEAFAELKRKYPNDLEIIIDGNMPLEKYLDVMRRANVIVDQVNSYSNGMNGVYAMAMGKVVMGGAEPESLTSLGLTGSPLINIRPSSKDIVDKIEKIMERRNEIEEIGYASRKFVEEVHGHIKVAEKYIAVWGDS